MATLGRSTGKRKSQDENYVDESLSDLECRSISPESDRDRERRIRREIANSNERRRMQSINSGFQALRMLLPNTEGEKLSKAAILQQTSEYIFSLEQDKTRLLQQNTTLKRILNHCERDDKITNEDVPPKKRIRAEESKNSELELPRVSNHIKSNSSSNTSNRDENENNICSDDYVEELQKELIDLRCQLEKERRLRISLEGQKQQLECDLNEVKLKSQVNSAKLATTHQSLDTIVQAIRHLEGSGADGDETPIKCITPEMLGSSSDFASRRLIV